MRSALSDGAVELEDVTARILSRRLQVFTSACDYFAALFDRGVTPLRFGTDEDRDKLNEVLRTSMTEALTMWARASAHETNLKACRRTRTRVQESQHLEGEIGSVFDAGQTMFSAALLAPRERSDEFQRRVADAQAQRDAATAALHGVQTALAHVVQDQALADARRLVGESALLRETDWLTRLRAVLAAAADVLAAPGGT